MVATIGEMQLESKCDSHDLAIELLMVNSVIKKKVSYTLFHPKIYSFTDVVAIKRWMDINRIAATTLTLAQMINRGWYP
jgi:hypothetical protein